MKQVRLFLVTTSVSICFLATNSCSQTTPASPIQPAIFTVTTPCNEIITAMLHISPDIKCEMMKWKLTLNQDIKNSNPYTFNLVCEYGSPKQGTTGFTSSAKKTELNGKWTIVNGTPENSEAKVYKLDADNAPVSLSFLNLDQNLLHLLDNDKHLMVGTAAWSYTLNRKNPVPVSPGKVSSRAVSSALDSIAGIFGGRTPCIKALGDENGVNINGCQIIKYKLTLYQETKTRTPTTYHLRTIYVGKGDSSYTNTGKWQIIRGTKADPGAIIYQLELVNTQKNVSLMKGDDNILFFLDDKGNLFVGNDYVSYTLNRVKN